MCELDDKVGALLKQLDDLKIADNTFTPPLPLKFQLLL
jgi:arylsulfatase A-like enzyme